MSNCTDCGDSEAEVVPNRYVLGTHPRLRVLAYDTEGVLFIPSEARLSVKSPDGEIVTWSGDDLLVASGYLYMYYTPEFTGWYQYETWVKDGNGLEDAATRGFEIYDYLYSD